jgi:hypothetical protein
MERHPMRLSLMALATILLIAASAATKASEGVYLNNPDGGAIRGFIIGIDGYEHVTQLKGSVADAHDIEDSLRKMGVSDIVTLIDAKANRSNILQTFSDLVQRTNANDLIILSIAGHGSQEPERIKGSEPDGLENVFLLSGFEPTPVGSQQRILGSEFNHFIRQFELRGAKVLFVADTCHGGGMARDIDPRAGEMSFRQVPTYRLAFDTLKPVTAATELSSDLDLDHTVFFAAVDRNTKAPEVRIPGISGLRGALSYAIARAIEGNADADHDGKTTLKELFANVRQVVYQLSDQRQSIVTSAPSSRTVDTDVILQFARGAGAPAPPGSQASSVSSAPSAVISTSTSDSGIAKDVVSSRAETPIRLAALDGKPVYFSKLTARETKFEVVQPVDNPDLLWDPSSHDVIAWGDVIAYQVDQSDLAAVIDRTSAIRDLKRISTTAPQPVRIAPNDRQQHSGQKVSIELSDVFARSIVVFDVSGDGTIQMLYPVGADAEQAQVATLELPVRVTRPFGAEQIVVVTSTEQLTELKQAVSKMNGRRASGLLVKTMLRYMPPNARVGSIGFFTAP